MSDENVSGWQKIGWFAAMFISIALNVIGFRNYGIASIGTGYWTPVWWVAVGAIGLVLLIRFSIAGRDYGFISTRES